MPELEKQTQANETPAPEKVEPKEVKLPDGDFFSGDKMDKWIEEMGLNLNEDEPQPPDVTPPPTKKAEEEECDECPGGKKQAQAAPEKVEPYAVIAIGGKKVEFPTKVEYDRYISETTSKPQSTPTKAEEGDMTLKKLGELQLEIQRLSRLESKATSQEDEELDEDTLEEFPALKSMKARLDRLEQENLALKGDKQERDMSKQAKVLDDFYKKARESHKFEDVIDEESGESITTTLFQGNFMSRILRDIKANTDVNGTVDPTKLRPLNEYMDETARHMSKLEGYYKNKFSSGNGGDPAPVTVELIKSNHPDIFNEIGEVWFAERQEKEEEVSNPTVRQERADTSPGKAPSRKGERKTFDEHMDDALNDPEIREAIAASSGGS